MRNIMWQRWQDPLLAHVNEHDHEDDDDGDVLIRNKFSPNKRIGPCIYSPIGIIPLHEENVPTALFNFWMGHTNFDIDDEAVEIIETTEGVETLDIFTRYRFRIAVGKSFEDKVVREAIFNAFQEAPEPEVPSILGAFVRAWPFWSVCYTATGLQQPVGGSTKEEVEMKIAKLGEEYIQREDSW